MSASAVSRVSRAEFDQLAHRGLAGEVSALNTASVPEQWQSTFPDWRGRYWTYTEHSPGVLRLHPLNITRAARAPHAA
ncbi:hypothetical protein [Nocardia vaccinii]|uniref:hypothetical protein n=1 Tax=Nocardia vaccinii TaxID=1822 RepID=UPI000830CA0E|nr:hypothetical protein [Nocardia vaccinii]